MRYPRISLNSLLNDWILTSPIFQTKPYARPPPRSFIACPWIKSDKFCANSMRPAVGEWKPKVGPPGQVGLPKDQVSLDPGEFYGLFGVYSLFMVHIYIYKTSSTSYWG